MGKWGKKSWFCEVPWYEPRFQGLLFHLSVTYALNKLKGELWELVQVGQNGTKTEYLVFSSIELLQVLQMGLANFRPLIFGEFLVLQLEPWSKENESEKSFLTDWQTLAYVLLICVFCTDNYFSSQQDLSSDCQSRRQGCWPLDQHHGPEWNELF